jgi:hypothetical protein
VEAALRCPCGDDPVAADLVPRYSPCGDHCGSRLGIGPDQLAQRRLRTEDHVVGQQQRAGLVLDQPVGAAHGVAEAQGLLLLHVDQLDAVGEGVHVGEDVQQVLLVPLGEVELELPGAIEMVDDGALAAADDHDDLLDPGVTGLLDAVLDGRLVEERKHLLGLSLGHRQEPRPEAGRGDYRLANRASSHGRQCKGWQPSRA